MLHTYNPQPMSLPSINFLHLMVSKTKPGQEVKVTTTRSKVKSRSHHDLAQLHPITNVPTKYVFPTPYGFQDISQTRFSNSRSLLQDQRSNQGHTMMLHSYTPLTNVPTKYQLPTFTFSEIYPKKNFSHRPPDSHLPPFTPHSEPNAPTIQPTSRPHSPHIMSQIHPPYSPHPPILPHISPPFTSYSGQIHPPVSPHSSNI